MSYNFWNCSNFNTWSAKLVGKVYTVYNE